MIELQGIAKTYALAGREPVHALRGVDLSVARGETLCLIGPSGCGKTTLLRLINRLEEPTSGRVLVGGDDVAASEPIRLRRRMGYVIQTGGLFPHLSVEQNVGLLCELEGWERSRTRERVHDLLGRVHLAPGRYASRFPAELSGGERQRVGVARALALDPEIVLLDEPFGALDPVTRAGLQDEFLELRADLDKTMVLVTHDLSEACRLADRIALLSRGRILQVGSAEDLRSAPASAEVEAFLGGGALG